MQPSQNDPEFNADGIAPQLTPPAKVQFLGPRSLHAVRGASDNDRCGGKSGESRGGCR